MKKSPNHRLSDQVLFALGRASQHAQRLVRQHMTEGGVRTLHYHVLASLADDGEAVQATLADRIGMDRSDLVTLLDELEELKMLARRVDAADRRRKIVAITPAGKQHLMDMDQLIYAAEADLLAPLTAAERKTLLALLRRVSGDQ
ncbi:MarR family winged helix-turn-helix transcriptional regulator [Kribbella sp.]|uniref:MarR family winged helix-turn-helix transcriptional regulator n=1 Tax=Kribbella sp. TaxID=1871183 RepID=UPI002D5C94C1|nr:MarR family winged helix-turn-helix transcriptional regulator [Kribbella sp.]HZX04701.1 MarR family winged helix-turn-helix transcriptional regulator [Kribbella sp.]